MSPARVKHPRTPVQPDYVLRFAPNMLFGLGGMYYAGGDPCFPQPVTMDKAARMRGAGLASAERALRRWGYKVERVAA
jgi:hypothetical protein